MLNKKLKLFFVFTIGIILLFGNVFGICIAYYIKVQYTNCYKYWNYATNPAYQIFIEKGQIPNNYSLNQLDEVGMLNNFLQDFQQNQNSIISTIFFSITETKTECLNCLKMRQMQGYNNHIYVHNFQIMNFIQQVVFGRSSFTYLMCHSITSIMFLLQSVLCSLRYGWMRILMMHGIIILSFASCQQVITTSICLRQ